MGGRYSIFGCNGIILAGVALLTILILIILWFQIIKDDHPFPKLSNIPINYPLLNQLPNHLLLYPVCQSRLMLNQYSFIININWCPDESTYPYNHSSTKLKKITKSTTTTHNTTNQSPSNNSSNSHAKTIPTPSAHKNNTNPPSQPTPASTTPKPSSRTPTPPRTAVGSCRGEKKSIRS